MKMTEQRHEPGPPAKEYITFDQCRGQAQKCIDESRRTQSSFNLSSAWLTLAELWVDTAASLRRAEGKLLEPIPFAEVPSFETSQGK
jgi:hypothetical protein